MCDTGEIMANQMDNQIEQGIALNDELERLQANIEACTNPLDYEYAVGLLEAFKEMHDIKKIKEMQTIKDVLIKFQEWQLNNEVLNANFAHNAAANLFLEKHNIKIEEIELLQKKVKLMEDFLHPSELAFVEKVLKKGS